MKTPYANKPAFTIVELLIVIVVIGILATVAVVAYNGIHNKAYDTTVRSDLANVSKQLEIIKVSLDRYPRVVSEFPATFKFSKNAYMTTVNNLYYCVNHTTDEYALGARSRSGRTYMLVTGAVRADVALSGVDVCSAIGTTWSSPPMPTSVMLGYNSQSGYSSTWSWVK